MTSARKLIALCVCCLISVLWTTAHAQDPKPPKDDKKEDTKVETKPEEPPDTSAEDQRILRDIGQATDGPALLDYLKKRTFPSADPKQVDKLINDMGDDDFGVREAAFAELAKLGSSALGRLKIVAQESGRDTEILCRTRLLVSKIEAKSEPAVQAAVARLIAKTKPAGAAEVILAYLPFAADQYVTDELCKSLGAVAVRDGKAEPAVVSALEDKLAIRRGAAGEALVRAKAVHEMPAVRKLLKDSEPSVRLRVALNLVHQKDRDALTALVECLEHVNRDQLWSAVEILDLLADGKGPNVALGDTEQSRKAARQAWQAWLDKEGAKVDWNRLTHGQTMLGYTLVVMQRNFIGGKNRLPTYDIFEIDQAKNERWKIQVPSNPVEAVVVGPDRVLVAEFQSQRVTERSMKNGEVLWEKPAGGNPIGVQRLPGGTTLIIRNNGLLEIDRNGNEVFRMDRPGFDIMRARKLSNGEVVFVTNTAQCIRIDKNQKVLKTFQAPQIFVQWGNIDVLNNGHVLMPDFQRGRVVEYDRDGKEVFSFNVQTPNSVQRLSNGNFLVSSQNMRRVAVFDRTGREIWNWTTNDGMPYMARRR